MPPVNKKINARKNPKNEKNKSTEGPEEHLTISGQREQNIKKSRTRVGRQRGVVVIRQLPHGFFEDQLKNYFQQFGMVKRLRLASWKRKGGSEGFAFVEFEFPEIAKVAAETMDNYLMFNKVVKALYIPPQEQLYNFFRPSVRRIVKVRKPIYLFSRTTAIQRQTDKYNKYSKEDYQNRISANERKLKIFKKKYADLGIDFDMFILSTKRQRIPKEMEETHEGKENENNHSKELKSEPGSLLLIKKRKVETKRAKKDKFDKKNKLKDLLENTLQDESSSDDEDFIPVAEIDTDDISDEERNNNEKESEKEPSLRRKKIAKSYEDRIAVLLKRKSNFGGIKKITEKNSIHKLRQPPKPRTIKNDLKFAAVIAIKEQGKMVQLKKKYFKKK